MENSSRSIIDNFPEPVREAMYALSEYYDYDYEEKNLYFALLKLKDWINKMKGGESILPKVFKITKNYKAIIKSIEEWKDLIDVNIMSITEFKKVYYRPELKSKRLRLHGKIQ